MDAVLLDLDDTLLPDGVAADAALEAAFADVLSPAQASAAAGAVRREAREIWRASPHWEWGQQDLGIASWELLWGPPPDRRLEAWLPGFRADVWRRALAGAGLHEGLAALPQVLMEVAPG